MPRRPLLLTLALLLAAPACTHGRGQQTDPPALAAPAQIVDLDDYAAASNAYALYALDDPDRAPLRAKLRDYLAGYVTQALAEDRPEAAVEALAQLADLWTPAELRAAAPDPVVTAAAEQVYQVASRVGDERPALLALGFAQIFGDAERRTKAEADYLLLVDWLERNRDFGMDPNFRDALERLLEDVSAILPSPFLIDALTDSYLARHRAAQQARVSDPRIAFTGYLVARAHLRADDPQAAIAAIDQLEVDESTRALRELIADAIDGEARSSAALVQLIREFVPTADSRLPESIIRQSWGIVANLAARTLIRFPDDPPAHLARGRVLRSRGLHEAAIVHYEQAFASKGRASDHADLHLAWSELAELYQTALEDRLRRDPAGADAFLARVETFHRRAGETWPQQPIEPGLSQAWMAVAYSAFDAGRVDEAERLLVEALAVEAHPLTLSLLGTIAMRRGDFDDARAKLQRITELPFADQLDRYDWQIQAAMQLGELELLAGRSEAGVEQLREALRQLNTLLAYPGLGELLRAEFLGRRASVFFHLGEIELAMKDFHEAHTLAPGHAGLYTDALTFTVVHGQLDQAAEIFASALAGAGAGADEDLAVYYALWVVDLANRLGKPELGARGRAFLQAYAADASHDAWQRELARHGLGELDSDALIAAAAEPRQRSEAFFYAGLQRWRAGRHDAGLELMRKVIGEKMMGDFEYQMAQSYLRWEELPKSARAAVD